MGASILPITIINNKIYFLFGKERDIDENPGWSDFGGGSEKGESFFETAIREGSEELTGFLGNAEMIKLLLKKNGYFIIDYLSNGNKNYRVHIFPIKYDENLTFYYNNNQKFLQKKLHPKIIETSKIFEKSEIKWFSFQEIINNITIFRTFYQNIIHLLIQNKLNITNFLNKKFIKKLNHLKTRKKNIK